MIKELLFIPTYNCEKQIIRVLEKIKKSNLYDKFQEILIIDNGSSDDTVNKSVKFIEDNKLIKIKIFLNKENYNLGGTHKVGFNYAVDNNYDYVSILHGDDQGEIDDFNKIIQKDNYKQYDCILGARFDKNSKLINYSKFRIFCNILINVAASIITLKKLKDLGAGLNTYKVSFLKNKFYLNFSNDLTFNYHLIFYICHSKVKFTYFPLIWREHDQISNVKLFELALKWLKIFLLYIFFKKKLFNNPIYQNMKYESKKII